MNPVARLRSLLLLPFLLALASAAPVPFANFVTRSGDKLMDGPAELRFISTNLPDALQIITYTGFDRTTNLRLPDDYELRDAVLTVKQMGGQVLRTFSITAKNGPGPEHMFDVASDPVVPNESALRVLDRLLQLCNEEGIRLYIPLIAYSNANRGDPSTYGADFWTVGSAANLKFKNLIGQLVNRTNVYTGVRYKDDKALLAWQSGNELVIGADPARRAWLHDLAAYLKSVDANHLFMDGRNRPDDIYDLYDEFFADPNIDVVSYHTYVNLPAFNTPASTLQAMRQYIAGRRPLVVSEIAMYTTESALVALLDEQIAGGTSGSNWWGHRFRNRDGGFYRHSDNGSLFEDLNWPGFPATAGYLPDLQKALSLQDILATRAHQIQGLARPPLPVPAPPVLLPIADVGHISWEGSTGAQSYDIARGPTAAGPWTIIQSDAFDHLVIADTLFCDHTAEPGASYYYRVIAKNSSGASAPSNVVGPVVVGSHWLVDDLFDLSRTFSSAGVQIKKAYNHFNYSNDLALLVRSDGASPGHVVYQVNGPIGAVTAYLHQSTVAPTFSGSTDGATFTPIAATFAPFGSRKLYLASPPAGSAYRYVKLQLNSAGTTEAIGRVEIEYAQPPGTVQSPTFTPAAGTYLDAQSVTIASTTPGASLRYTTDGSVPTAANGALYTGPVTVSATGTLRAVAFKAGSPDSAVSNASYVIQTTAGGVLEAESLSPAGIGNSVSVEADGPASGGQWSKFNGSAPGQAVEFTTPPLLAGTYDVYYRYKTGGPRAQHDIAIDGVPLGGVIDQYAATSFYVIAHVGARTFATAGTHTFRLTVTGKNPASTGYLIGSDAFIFTPVGAAPAAAPTFSPAAGSYPGPQTITLTSATAGASIRYTTNGSTPSSTSGTLYSGPFVLSASTTVKAVAYKAGLLDSSVSTAAYTIAAAPSPIALEAENLSPVGIGAGVSVELDGPASGGRWSKLNGSAIGHATEFTTPTIPAGTYEVRYRYKTGGPRAQHNVAIDGIVLGGVIDPYATTSFYLTASLGTVSFAQAGPHQLRLTVTGRNAASTGYLIGSDAFTFIPLPAAEAPVFDPPGGTFHQPQSVSLSSATTGAALFYTTDGSAPTAANGTPYTAPIALNAPTTLKAIAVRNDLADSPVATAVYQIIDDTPPAIVAPADFTIEATGPNGAVVTYAASANDDFDGSVEVSSSRLSGSTFPLGVTPVTLQAVDAAGNLATATFTVTVADTTAPVFTTLTASPDSIWPPNKKMVPVTLSAAATDGVGVTAIQIVSVTCNEAAGSSAWQITGPLALKLKADRHGHGAGRIYTITVEARDAAGNSATRTVVVRVPHDRSKE